ncbi:zinc metalloproteinase nas-8-like isoform X2 [Daphnia carinata]|uniref:zinc metalloproteinase nas-8-like isoform X2 n=1 Tax=Daphnia carinata TaxID=120202 RepID=UPI0028684163|nr:zinc metalloproteinase nas-8-like isoform X2 [Daphnia carinata]
MMTRTLIKVMAIVVCIRPEHVSAQHISDSNDDQTDDFQMGEPLTEEEFNSNIFNKVIDGLEYETVESIAWDKQDPELFGGDIVPTGRKHGVLTSRERWPNAKIPYVISSSYTPRQREIIASAINAYHNNTCIRFIRRTTEKNYVRITKTGQGCWSDVGKIGQRQTVSLDDRCILRSIPGLIVHELMHTLGFYHEHQRPDRDNYVFINLENVEPKNRGYFKKMNMWDLLTVRYSYDYGSVMHYPSNAFAKDPTIRVITRLQGPPFIANREGFSPTDIVKLNSVYCNSPN